MQLRSGDLILIVGSLLGVSIGLLLVIFPHHLIRYLGKLARSYYQGLGVSDRTLDDMAQLPWSRFVQDGLPYSRFWQEAVDHPKRFTVWTGIIRLFGVVVVLLTGGVLLLALLARLAGVME
jgi:hypothetical protein